MSAVASRLWFYPLLFLVSVAAVLLGVVALTLAIIYPNLPSLDVLTDYRPNVPLRVYTADNQLLGEFGRERRALVKFREVPELMKQAILAAEDERFYEHGGVDYLGVARAALSNLAAGGAREGASTITMQVARNFFLSNEKTLTRKLSEVLLAFKIERNLSKDQIFELYINQIYLGERAYGFAAAASTYFAKQLADLTPAEAAMLAGLPKAPSSGNPFANLKRATQRQHYVLRRMRDLGFITAQQYDSSVGTPVRLAPPRQALAASGEYVAEMARQAVFEQFGEAAYTGGYTVYTTVLSREQEAAYAALRKGVLEYDRRHGYRGPEGTVTLAPGRDPSEEAFEEALADRESSGDLIPAVVVEANAKQVRAWIRGVGMATIAGDGLKFAARSIGDKVPQNLRIQRGSLVRASRDDKGGWQIAQLPAVEAALVALDQHDGALRAVIGGFDFARNKFNHATQAWRQPGSSFKPFVYSAALEKGFTPATVVNDAPIVLEASKTGSGEAWEPKNYDGKYDGPIRVRTGLAKSKNMVSIRLLQAIGPRYAQDYVTRFGFDPKFHPAYLTMALGAGSATPVQMAAAYGVFANGGWRVEPYFIRRVVDQRGTAVMEAKVTEAGGGEPAIDPRNAFIMQSMMRDVVKYGTAARAMSLGRNDLAGKTGTTNDHVDAWFCGFNAKLVAVAWIGYDTPRDMGAGETGSQAALPLWIYFMGQVLKGIPEQPLTPPSGIVVVPIDPVSGLRASEGGVNEYFLVEFQPGEGEAELGLKPDESEKPQEEIKNQLF